MLFLIGYPLIVISIIVLASALLLGIGTALTFVFAVSVWEATVVTMVVSAGVFWVHFFGWPHAPADDLSDGSLPDEEAPRIIITDLPFRSSRRGKQRRR